MRDRRLPVIIILSLTVILIQLPVVFLRTKTEKTSVKSEKGQVGTKNRQNASRIEQQPLDDYWNGEGETQPLQQLRIRQFNEERTGAFNSNPTRGFSSFARRGKFGTGYQSTGGELPIDRTVLRSGLEAGNSTCIVRQESKDDPQRKTRAPHAIILGAMKSGTTALTHYLWEHPSIIPSRAEELHFFDSPSKFNARSSQGIDQEKAQDQLREIIRKQLPDLQDDTQNYYAIDSTPRYLVWSDRIADEIMCTTPWAKLLVILRNPIERAESHYRYLDQARGRNQLPMVDWDRWVQDDFRLLRKAGLIQDNPVEREAFFGSPAELKAWRKYVHKPNSQLILGRGLYAIQLEHYLKAMDRAGKPRSDLKVIHSQDMKQDPQAVYEDVLEFLNLSPHQLQNSEPVHTTSVRDTSIPMPSHIRQQLEEFFEPYNKRLYDLLGWDPVWDPKE